jgi:hypothetical protein
MDSNRQQTARENNLKIYILHDNGFEKEKRTEYVQRLKGRGRGDE